MQVETHSSAMKADFDVSSVAPELHFSLQHWIMMWEHGKDTSEACKWLACMTVKQAHMKAQNLAHLRKISTYWRELKSGRHRFLHGLCFATCRYLRGNH